MGRIFSTWFVVMELHLYYERAVNKMKNRHLSRCFNAWRHKDFFFEYCRRRILKRRLAATLSAWISWWKTEQEKKSALSRMEWKRLWRYFKKFVDGCMLQKWRRSMKKKSIEKLLHCKVRRVFQMWICFVQAKAQKKMLKLQDYVATIEKENQRSRSECDRLARILDTGEWGKQQLSEILQARDVLSEEREALTKLIDHLQQQQSLVLEQQKKNEEGMRQLKDQILGNALKRGVEPDFLYALDKMSMDKVSIFPDGEMRVKSLSTMEKGKWIARQSNPILATSRSATFSSHKSSCQDISSPSLPYLPPQMGQEGFGSTRIIIEPNDKLAEMLSTKISVEM
eukprot:c43596_g1_i1 orf=164-1183(+)